jgi:hypothetical protein
MSLLLIAFDLTKTDRDYSALYNQISTHVSWKQLSGSAFAIETFKTPEALFDEFIPFLDDDDNIYVTGLKFPCVARGPQETTGWLSKKLSR